MAISKVTYAGNTLIDLTGDTVAPENLLSGATAHAANGEEITGIVEDKKGELEAQIADLRNQISALNSSLSTITTYSGTADITQAYTDFTIGQCTLSAGTYLVYCEMSIQNSLSDIGYFLQLKQFYGTVFGQKTYQRVPGYDVNENMLCLVKLAGSTTLSLTVSANYLKNQASAGTATGKISVIKLQ